MSGVKSPTLYKRGNKMNKLFELIDKTTPNVKSFIVNKKEQKVDIKTEDGAVVTISFDFNINDNRYLRVAVDGFEYHMDGVKNTKKLETLDMTQPIGNTIALLSKYAKDFNVSIYDLNVFLEWTREDIIDFLKNHYNIINECA